MANNKFDTVEIVSVIIAFLVVTALMAAALINYFS